MKLSNDEAFTLIKNAARVDGTLAEPFSARDLRDVIRGWKYTDYFSFLAYRGRNKSSAKPYALMSDLGFPAAFKLPRFHEGGQLSSLCTVLEMTSRTDGYHTLIRGFYRLTIFDAGLPLSKDGCLSQRTSRVP